MPVGMAPEWLVDDAAAGAEDAGADDAGADDGWGELAALEGAVDTADVVELLAAALVVLEVLEGAELPLLAEPEAAALLLEELLLRHVVDPV